MLNREGKKEKKLTLVQLLCFAADLILNMPLLGTSVGLKGCCRDDGGILLFNVTNFHAVIPNLMPSGNCHHHEKESSLDSQNSVLLRGVY